MDNNFNMQGGFFSPTGYFKVETGGTHDENPNGGVQIGVDQQGIPNMLEEGEPVYNDYVYSDNIRADKAVLKQFNLPEKYAGKLYSDIADAYVDEAEVRPLDTVSNNGLKVMLGRLADAQEYQKQLQEEKELEDELANLSPEELAELEAMLAEQGQEQMPVQQEQVVAPEMMQQPVMALGGAIRRFDGGTPGEIVIPSEPPYTGEILPDYRLRPIVDISDTDFGRGINNFNNTALGEIIDAVTPDGVTEALGGSPLLRQAGRTIGPIGRTIGRGVKRAGNAIKKVPQKIAEIGGRKQMVKEAKDAISAANEAAASAKATANSIAEELGAAKEALKSTPNDRVLLQRVAELEAQSAKADAAALKASAKATGTYAGAAGKVAGAFTTGPLYNRAALEKEITGLQKAYNTAKKAAEEAPKDESLQKAAEVALKNLEKAQGAWNKWWGHGQWQWKGAIAGGVIGAAVAHDSKEKKKNWVEAQFANGGNLIRRFDDGTPGEIVIPQLADLPLDILYDDFSDVVDDTDVSGIDSSVPRVALMSHRIPGLKFISDDGNVIAYEYPEELQPAISTASMSPRRGANSGSSSPLNDNRTVQNPAPDLSKYDKPDFITDEYSWLDDLKPEDILGNRTTGKGSGTSAVPHYATWPRYAGIAHNIFTAGVNMFQQPDHYEFPYLRAHEPEMQLPVLIDPRYRPTDRNLVVNNILASSAGNARQILNSGNPVSAPANLIALDYVTGQNIGNGLLQVDDANNTQLNNVISGKNNNRMQLGQLAFELARARSAALSNADRINSHSNMMQQIYNNQAEQQWADAVGTPLDYFAQGMADIGYENMNRNMINSNRALKYGSYGTGVGFYKGSRGGMLKTYKK